MADGEVQEEWSWSDSDGDGGEMSLQSPGAAKASQAPAGLTSSGSGYIALGASGSDPRKSVKVGVRQMVALGLCSPQAAEMFLQIDSGSRLPGEPIADRNVSAFKDQLAATEARLAASERALQQSEQEQTRLQAEIMQITLNPHQGSASENGGVTAFDVARAQREAEKIMTLQRKVAEGEERERQQATMQAKMEELLRLQEVALSEREEGTGALEKDLAERDAKLRLLSEQLLQTEQTHAMEQEAATTEIAELKARNQVQIAELKADIAELKARNQVLEDGIVDRDEQLRRTDGEKLRLHEIQMEEKENQLRNLEARLAANGGDQIQTLKTTFSHTLEDRELRLATLEHEVKQVKAERDDAQRSYMSMQSTCRELRMESEHLQMALTIVEPKVHVLHAMVTDIQLHLQGLLNERDNKIFTQQQQLDKTLPRMHGHMEEMKKALNQRDHQINSSQQELGSLRNILKERESKIPELQDALEKQREMTTKLQEDLFMKNQRIETLQSALEQMQYALDGAQKMMGDRDSRLQLLQASLDNSQPAMSIARKAIEERDMKLNAFQMLLHMGENQVQENVKALDEAMQSLKEKDESIKLLQARIDERDSRIGDMENSLVQWRSQLDERDWQINAHESKISDLHDKLHSIDREQANEAVAPAPASNHYSNMLNETRKGSPGREVFNHDRVQDQDLKNGASLKGCIALIERGLCTFQDKAARAYNAGAIGIVFANSGEELYQPVSSAKQGRDATPIPMLCIKKSEAAMLVDGMAVAMLFSNQAQTSVKSPSSRAAGSHHGSEAPQQLTARQRVLQGAVLQEWTRGKHTGSFVAGDAFVKVTPSAEIIWKNRCCKIVRVCDGFTKALSQAKPAESNSKCGFSVRVASDERASDVYDLELMAPSDHEKMHWISGILEIVKDQLSIAAPKYTGEKSSGIPKGKGLGEYPNGDQYMGEWESGFQHGTANGIVPLPHGQGVFAWRNADLYRGDWNKGVRSGYGTLETSDGAIYQGQWDDDRMSGSGIQVSAAKEKFVGTFLEGFRHGVGVLTQRDGAKKSVEYSAGVETNKGPYPHPNPSIQTSLIEISKQSRYAAKTAAEKAEAAQSLCKSAEGLIHQVSTAANPNSPPPVSTFASLQRPGTIPASIPSTPGSIRPIVHENGAGGQQARGHTSTPFASLASPFPGSPIMNTPQTPYASMGPGNTVVQSPVLGMVGR